VENRDITPDIQGIIQSYHNSWRHGTSQSCNIPEDMLSAMSAQDLIGWRVFLKDGNPHSGPLHNSDITHHGTYGPTEMVYYTNTIMPFSRQTRPN
jgi:hypothetical protein